MEWILSIAGIFFGGGLIGQLIIFFVERHDKKKNNRIEHYRVIYDKLCNYTNDIENLFLESLKFYMNLYPKVKGEREQVEERNIEIKELINSIEKIKRKCKKGKVNSFLCNECQQKREKLPLLHQEMKEKLDNVKGLLDIQKNYWKNNNQVVSSVIANNINIHNYLLARKIKDKKLSNAIGLVDLHTLKIYGSLVDEENLPHLLIDQMIRIKSALGLLSKKIG